MRACRAHYIADPHCLACRHTDAVTRVRDDFARQLEAKERRDQERAAADRRRDRERVATERREASQSELRNHYAGQAGPTSTERVRVACVAMLVPVAAIITQLVLGASSYTVLIAAAAAVLVLALLRLFGGGVPFALRLGAVDVSLIAAAFSSRIVTASSATTGGTAGQIGLAAFMVACTFAAAYVFARRRLW